MPSDPHCNRPGCGSFTLHVGWKKTRFHYYKVFSCHKCGQKQFIPWDHEAPR